jgi:peroxiredoxin
MQSERTVIERVIRMKLVEGIEMTDFSYTTIDGTYKSFRAQLNNDYTVILFLRHYGCGMSQLDMLKYRDAYQFLQRKGVDVFMVIQEPTETIAEKAAKANIPFPIISDPEQILYQLFEIPSSESVRKLVAGVSEEKLNEMIDYGIDCYQVEGNELQLQATVAFNRSGQVVYSHYAENISDVPSPTELVERLEASLA